MKITAFSRFILFLFLTVSCLPSLVSQNKKMPKEDVIDIPALGEGLCVHNLFQSNMVLQRNKPITICQLIFC